MSILIVAVLAAVLVLIVLMLTRRTVSFHRAVLLHAPVPLVWPRIEDFPVLLAEHGRGRALGAYGRYSFVRGDARSSGSVWRTFGTWAGAEYWADVELVRIEAGREIVVRLLRDSLQTHHGLRGSIARLTLQPNGAGTSKLTWDLQARFRPSRLLWHRHCSRDRLKARLLDLCLRSVKIAIDSEAHDRDADPGATTRPADGDAVVPSPPADGRGGPRLHPC